MQHHRLTLSITLATALALAGCAMPTASTGGKSPGTTQAQKKDPAPSFETGLITGQIVGPASAVISAGAGNVISAGSGNVISAGAGNYGLLAAVEEKPLAKTRVYLANAAGDAYPGIAAVETDAEGQYQFKDVPAGVTFMVVAEGVKPGSETKAYLQTLVRADKLGATANINASTTLVTAGVVEGLSDLGEFKPASFKTAVEATAKELTPEDLPDFSDRAAVTAAINKLAAEIEAIKTVLAEIKASLQKLEDKLEAIEDKLSAPPGGQPLPGGQPPPGGQEPPGGPPPGDVQPVDVKLMLEGTHPLPLTLKVYSPGKVHFITDLVFRTAGTPITGRLALDRDHELWLAQPGGQEARVGSLRVGSDMDLTKAVMVRITPPSSGGSPGGTAQQPEKMTFRIALPERLLSPPPQFPIEVAFRAPDNNPVGQVKYMNMTDAVNGLPMELPPNLGHHVFIKRQGMPDFGPMKGADGNDIRDLKLTEAQAGVVFQLP